MRVRSAEFASRFARFFLGQAPGQYTRHCRKFILRGHAFWYLTYVDIPKIFAT